MQSFVILKAEVVSQRFVYQTCRLVCSDQCLAAVQLSFVLNTELVDKSSRSLIAISICDIKLIIKTIRIMEKKSPQKL